MAHHKSCLKRIKTSAKANEVNRAYRSRIKTVIKRVQESGNKEMALEQFKSATALLDRMVSKNIIHRNNAANQKSRLSGWINKNFAA